MDRKDAHAFVESWLRTAEPMHFITSRVVTVDDEAAGKLLSMNFERNRRQSEDSVIAFARRVDHDAWAEATQIRIVVDGRGRAVLTDGQHRLMSVLHSGKPRVFEVLVLNGDPARDYAHADTIAQPKSAVNILDASGKTPRALASANIKLRGAFISASRIVLAGMRRAGRNQIPEYVALPFLVEMGEQVDVVARLLVESGAIAYRRRVVTSGPFVASMLVTAKYCPQKTFDGFWRGALSGEMMAQDDPRMRLFLYALNAPTTGADSEFDKLAACSQCWNAYACGKTMPRLPKALEIERMIGVPDSVYEGYSHE